MARHHPLDWLPEQLDRLEQADLRRRRRIGAGSVTDCVDFGANDYLGLAGDLRVAEAASRAIQDHGWGAGASPVVSGRSQAHARLEERLAAWEQTEAAIVFPSGFAANAGVIPALVDRGDALYADAKNHASLIDGCRLSRAERFVYPHNEVQRLAHWLEEHQSRFRRRMIVTDGLFSMDGDFAPLAELGELAERYDAMLLVDEAHATGVWGANGRGSVELASESAPRLESQVTIRIGTLSKAFGSAGGFVAGSRDLVDWLYNRARPYVYSTAPPPAVAAASLAALEIAVAEPARRERVQRSAAWLRERLVAAGWDLGESRSQIVPIRVVTPENALALGELLARAGFFVPVIRPPTVPTGESMLRVSVSAHHTDEQLQRLVAALGRAERSV